MKNTSFWVLGRGQFLSLSDSAISGNCMQAFKSLAYCKKNCFPFLICLNLFAFTSCLSRLLDAILKRLCTNIIEFFEMVYLEEQLEWKAKNSEDLAYMRFLIFAKIHDCHLEIVSCC